MGGAVSALVVLGVLFLVGLPVALSIRGMRGTRPEWTGLAFESAVIGLVIELVVAMTLVHASHYSSWTALGLTIVVVVALAFAVRFAGARSGAAPTDFSLLKQLEPALVGLATLALIIVAVRIRHAPSYFLFQTGDMGGYVNGANILLVKGGTSLGRQPQGFTLFLRETNLLLGKANTVAGLPALGAIMLLGVVAFARTLKLHVAVALGFAFLIAVHPVMVWFSLFPVSEALFAPLLLALFYFVVRARTEQSSTYAVMAGVIAGALLIVRGEAMLLAPILLVVFLASAAVDDDDTAAIHRRFTIAALVSLFAAYVFDVQNSNEYFNGQLRHLLPKFLYRFADRANLIEISIPLIVAGVLALALVLGAGWLVTRYARPHTLSRPQVFWWCAYGVVIVGAVAISTSFWKVNGLGAALWRWGPLLLVLVAVGVLMVVYRPGKYLDATCGLLFLLVIAVYGVLFTRRVPIPKPQANYLYYDRYVFSEILPAALLFGAIGLQVMVTFAERIVSTSRALRIAVVTGVIAVLVIALIPQEHETGRITKFRLLGSSYHALQTIDTLTRSHGEGPVVYSGSGTRTPNWTFQNTYRAFALPLAQTFNRQVLGFPVEHQAKDETFKPAGALAELERNGLHAGYLVRLRYPGQKQPYPNNAHTQYVGAVTYACPILEQSAHAPDVPWKVAVFHFDVYLLH
jgi:hypothetical protein